MDVFRPISGMIRLTLRIAVRGDFVRDDDRRASACPDQRVIASTPWRRLSRDQMSASLSGRSPVEADEPEAWTWPDEPVNSESSLRPQAESARSDFRFEPCVNGLRDSCEPSATRFGRFRIVAIAISLTGFLCVRRLVVRTRPLAEHLYGRICCDEPQMGRGQNCLRRKARSGRDLRKLRFFVRLAQQAALVPPGKWDDRARLVTGRKALPLNLASAGHQRIVFSDLRESIVPERARSGTISRRCPTYPT